MAFACLCLHTELRIMFSFNYLIIYVQLIRYIWCVIDFLPEPAISRWALVFVIVGATLLACLSVTFIYCYYQRRKRSASGRPFAVDDSVYDPILNGNTIQDIIEMTTSGSGSGIYLCKVIESL